MNAQELLQELRKEGLTEERRIELTKQLQAVIKEHNDLHDDHGSPLFGLRESFRNP